MIATVLLHDIPNCNMRPSGCNGSKIVAISSSWYKLFPNTDGASIIGEDIDHSVGNITNAGALVLTNLLLL